MSDAPRLQLTRRELLTTAVAFAGVAIGTRSLTAQQAPQNGVPGATMEGDGYIPVRRPPKPGAVKSMTDGERDVLEHRLSCPCPCTLDVFTCRTSMPCGFSPRLHADVVALVDGGYSADEIVTSFVASYGEQALMVPTRQGFNWVGWLAPFAAIGGGGAVLALLIRRWGQRAGLVAKPLPIDVTATPEELARLDAAVRGDRG